MLANTFGADRAKGRLKDDFGGRHIRVRGNAKVMSHLTFGVLELTADQLLGLPTVSPTAGSKKSETELAGDGTRPQGRGNAINQKDYCKKGRT